MSRYEKGWQDVRERIAKACAAASRPPDSVRLLAVSKTFPPAAITAVHGFGQRAFGENYVQEAVAKQMALGDPTDVEWHLIGPLQSNKSKVVAERFAWVQTVDRIEIARRLSSQRPEAMPPLNVCVQANVSGEASKSGVAPGAALELAMSIADLPRLRLRGIMGIPEATGDEERLRAQFRMLRGCFDACRAAGLPLDTLSMGMSADLALVIAEGSTMVRVGTAIFGARAAHANGRFEST